MPGIHFHVEEVKNPLAGKVKKYKTWLNSIAASEGGSIEEIHYIFCNDAYILEINKSYLNHDYYTDIITFPYSRGKTKIKSDIFISLETVATNGEKFNETFQQELHRVMAHGLLHLLGYNDKTDEEEKIMRKKENDYIRLWENLDISK